MTIVIFIIVLALLIFVHELGHFIFAKATGMRVDEFGIGFPPRIWSVKKGETIYSLNLIPFGGYVKIFGENPDQESISGPERDRSFVGKSKAAQALVLVAGVTFNILFAWLLISVGFMTGLPASASDETLPVRDAKIIFTSVLPESPASEAGFKPGDELVSISSGDFTLEPVDDVDEVQNFIADSDGNLAFSYIRGGESFETEVVPEEGIVEDKVAIGVTLDKVGTVKLNPFAALIEGAKRTANLTVAIAVALFEFIVEAFRGAADFSQVAGPVGIVGMVGDASALGFVYLLTFTAFISIHLAIINLVPFPALDGGRLLFVLIEKIKGSPIKPAVANTLNFIGFAFLMLLMIAVTINDVVRLF